MTDSTYPNMRPMSEAPKDGTFIWVEGKWGPVPVAWLGRMSWRGGRTDYDMCWRTRRDAVIFMPKGWWPEDPRES